LEGLAEKSAEDLKAFNKFTFFLTKLCHISS